jgi:uncharacterized protein
VHHWRGRQPHPRPCYTAAVFIDVHAHAYSHACPPQDGHTQFAAPEEVIRRFDQIGVERGFLLPLIGPETYLPQSNEDVMEACARSGGRLLPFCNIDPRGMTNTSDAPLGQWLRWYKAHGCVGLGEVMPNLPFLHPQVQNLFRHAEAVGLPLTFDSTDRIGAGYGLQDDPGLPQLEESLRRFPRLTIVGHGPSFWAEIAELESPAERARYPKTPVRREGAVPALFRRFPNLWADLSAGSGFNALARDPAYAARFLDEFQDRLMFGTDICSAGQELPLPGFLDRLREEGRLSEAAFRKIARENATRLYGLSD